MSNNRCEDLVRWYVHRFNAILHEIPVLAMDEQYGMLCNSMHAKATKLLEELDNEEAENKKEEKDTEETEAQSTD